MTYYLTGLFVVFCLGSAATYNETYRRGSLYTPTMVLLGVFSAVIFAAGCRFIDSKSAIYRFSLYGDVLMAVAYYAFPLFALGVRIKPCAIAGAVLVVVGLVMVHAWSE